MSAGVNKAPRGAVPPLQRSQSSTTNARPLPTVPNPNQPQRGSPNLAQNNNRGSPGSAPARQQRVGTAPPPIAPHPLGNVPSIASPNQSTPPQPQPQQPTNNNGNNNINKNAPVRGSPLACRGNSDSSLPINNRGGQRGGAGSSPNPMQKRGSAPSIPNARGGQNQPPQQRGARGGAPLRASNSLRSLPNDRGKPGGPQQQQQPKRKSGPEAGANSAPVEGQPNGDSEQEVEDLEKKRLFVVRELVDTERSYSKSLNLLVQVIIDFIFIFFPPL